MTTTPPHQHIVLLGDSILDNAPYVGVSPAVSDQLSTAVANRKWKVTLRAVDGAKMQHIPKQLANLPTDASLFVLSIGGNDGLAMLPRLKDNGYNPFKWASMLKTFLADFEADYKRTLDLVLLEKKPLVVLTIYQPYFENSAVMTGLTASGVWLMNWVIVAAARARNLPVIDLWQIFNKKEDYANSIEPGVPGGHKLVKNLLALIDGTHGNRLHGGFSISADCSYAGDFQPHGHAYWRPTTFQARQSREEARRPIAASWKEEEDIFDA